MIGTLFTLFVSLSSIIFCKIFKVKDRGLQFFVASLIVTASAHTYLSSTFQYDLDIHACAEFFTLLSIYFLQKNTKLGLLWSVLTLIYAISLYQSYINFFLVLCCFIFIYDLYDRIKFREIFWQAMIFLAVAVVALILYRAFVEIYLILTRNNLATSGNSIGQVAIFTSVSYLLSMTVESIKTFYHELTYYPSFNYIFALICNILLALFITYAVLFKSRLSVLSKLLCLLTVFLLIPFAASCIYILSKGYYHALMKFAINATFLLPVIIINKSIQMNLTAGNNGLENNDVSVSCTLPQMVKNGIIAVLLLSVCNSILFSNNVYLKKYFEDRASLSAATRILYKIEEFQQFDPDKTPVCFIGNLSANFFNEPRNLVEDLGKIEASGIDEVYAFTWNPWLYYRNILGYKMKYCELSPDLLNSIGRQMPAFPKHGGLLMHDGNLIVKFSDFKDVRSEWWYSKF